MAQAQTPAKAGCQNYKNVSKGIQPVLNFFITRINALDGILNSLKGMLTSTNSHFDLSLFYIYVYIYIYINTNSLLVLSIHLVLQKQYPVVGRRRHEMNSWMHSTSFVHVTTSLVRR